MKAQLMSSPERLKFLGIPRSEKIEQWLGIPRVRRFLIYPVSIWPIERRSDRQVATASLVLRGYNLVHYAGHKRTRQSCDGCLGEQEPLRGRKFPDSLVLIGTEFTGDR